MITDDEVMRLFEQADPARTTDDHNDTPDATGYLAALRTRSNNVTYIDTTETSTEQPDHRRWYMIGAGVAAVAILVVGGLVLLTGGEGASEPEVPATAPPTVPPTTAVAPPVEDAVGRATAFLASFEQRDVALVEEQLADGFVARSSFPGEQFGEPSTFESNGWGDLRYQVLTATRYVDPVCTVITPGETESVVECETTMQFAAHWVTNTPGVPVVVTMNVTDAGIATMDSALGSNLGYGGFGEWLDANWPAGVPLDDDLATFEDLVEFATTEEQLAADWVAFGVDAAEAMFSDFNSGELDAFLARLRSSSSFAPEDEIAASIANGTQYVASGCTPDGIAGASLAVVCDVVVRDGSFATTGVEVSGSYRLLVRTDGRVDSTTNTVDWSSMNDYRAAFEQWLADAHPDVHGQVNWIDVEGSRVAGADDQPVVAQYVEEFVAQSDVYPLGG